MIKTILAVSVVSTTFVVAIDEMPLGAKAGQCFTKSFYPPKYTKVTKVKSTKKVIVNKSSIKYDVIPAQYSTHIERVKISDGKERIEITPAVYKTVYERILVKPSETIWTNSNGSKAFKSCVDAAKLSGMDTENVEAGTCYYEHYEPAEYRTVTSKILASEASERLEVIPAQYRKIFKKIKTDSTSIKLLPSVAKYKKVKDKIEVEPARTEWKKTICDDQGCNQSEVVCLIEVPTTYKQVTRKIVLEPAVTQKVAVKPTYKTVEIEELLTPASVRSIPIPATYKTIAKKEKLSNERYFWTDASAQNSSTRLRTQCDKICLIKTAEKYKQVEKKVIQTPAMSKKVKTPARYTNVKVKKIIKEASFKKVVIPAEYITVVTERERTKGFSKWMPMMCEELLTPSIIKKVQNALKLQGFYNGEINGIWNLESKSATRAYQKANGLAVTNKLSIEAMKALNIY